MSDSEEESSSTNTISEWPVTEEWLQDVLKEHHKDLSEGDPGISIVNFNVRPGCDEGESVLSDILAVAIKYKIRDNPSDQELSIIIKLLPQDPFSRFFVTEAQFDLREIKFYTQVVPDLENFKRSILNQNNPNEILKLPIPICYYAHYSPGAIEPEPSPPESVLVLENIRALGYSAPDFAKGLTLRQVTASIDAIAEMHALSLCFKINKKKDLSEKYPFLFNTMQASDSYQQLVERGLPQLFQFLNSKDELKDILSALNDLRPHTKDIIANLLAPKEPIALITHTDFWCNNLMFKEDEQSCRCSILDWQMVTYSRPTNDLALLMVSSVPTELRRNHLTELLDHYWEKLTSNCKLLKVDIENDSIYDRCSLEEDFKWSQLLALLLCIGSVDLALGNAQMEDRLVSLLQDLHKEGLLTADTAKPDDSK